MYNGVKHINEGTAMKTFHKIFYTFMRILITPFFRFVFHYSWKKYEPKSETYLVLTNHNTNWDFFLFGLSLHRHMYFVASEHIYRLGFRSKLIKFLADPIPRKKGASGSETTELILSRLRDGSNVCMMAEGNRSWNGRTGFISPRTAQLAKDSGVGLITYRVHGGYFVNPRWGTETRRGPSRGEVVNEYTAEELAEMSVDEINEAIRRDLYVDAYADQRESPAAYTCKHPAEHLETALFVCPECHSFSSMRSSKRRFYCADCGMTLLMSDYGYFEDANLGDTKFRTVPEWDDWQQQYMRSYLASVGDGEKLFSDWGLRLSKVCGGETAVLMDYGSLTMYSDRLELSCDGDSFSFAVDKIEKISIALTSTLLFTYEGGYYEIKSGQPYSALKYLIAARLLAGKEYI